MRVPGLVSLLSGTIRATCTRFHVICRMCINYTVHISQPTDLYNLDQEHYDLSDMMICRICVSHAVHTSQPPDL